MTRQRVGMHLLLLVAGVSMLGGCNDKLKAERDALWAANQEYRAREGEVNEQLERTRADRDRLVAETARLQSELDAAHAAAAAANAKPVAAANRGTGFDSIEGITTEQSPGLITVRIPGDVLFASGKVDLRNDAKATLQKIAQVIKRDYSDKMLRVAGYTDTDPIVKSNWKDNLELSLQRAASVHRFLQESGVDAKQMYAAGYGQWHPRGTKAQSRRVEIIVEVN